MSLRSIKNELALFIVCIFSIIICLELSINEVLIKIVAAVLIVFLMIKIKKQAVKDLYYKMKQLNNRIILLLILNSFWLYIVFAYIAVFLVENKVTVPKSFLPLGKLLAMVIVAPITEEIVFRWAVVEAKEKTNKIISIIIYGVMIFIWNMVHTKSFSVIDIFVVIVGLVLYGIYFTSGNIYYCIIFHGVYNVSAYMFNSPLIGKVISLFKNKYLGIIIFILLVVDVFLYLKEVKMDDHVIHKKLKN